MTREEWDSRHQPMFRDGMRVVLCGEPVLPLKAPTYVTEQADGDLLQCVHCGPRPAAAAVLTREEWDAKHLERGGGHRMMYAQYPGEGCPKCGPRPAASRAVATEWALLGNMGDGECGGVSCDSICPVSRKRGLSGQCHSRGYKDAEGHRYEYRWPSGTVGEGKPEFRRVTPDGGILLDDVSLREPAPAVEPEHVHLRELVDPKHRRNANGEQAWRACSKCLSVFPAAVGDAIALGTLDCPSCGWHSGRCEHCNTKLVNSYVRGERDHGVRHCPQCYGVDDV